jgi:hypothetical protein
MIETDRIKNNRHHTYFFFDFNEGIDESRVSILEKSKGESCRRGLYNQKDRSWYLLDTYFCCFCFHCFRNSIEAGPKILPTTSICQSITFNSFISTRNITASCTKKCQEFSLVHGTIFRSKGRSHFRRVFFWAGVVPREWEPPFPSHSGQQWTRFVFIADSFLFLFLSVDDSIKFGNNNKKQPKTFDSFNGRSKFKNKNIEKDRESEAKV